MDIGITAFGAYIPRLRLARKAVLEANGWFSPGLKSLARGERAIANWDEDAVTMAVEAARDCLTSVDRAGLKGLYLASTSYPFDDRQNGGIVAQALTLESGLSVLDVAASQRAGTSGLIAALQAAQGGGGPILVIAADKRRTKTASPQEMSYGDGAAALLVGGGVPLAARFIGAHSETVDFVDHYRGHGRDFDYGWEERWIRDEGFLKIVPRAVQALVAKTGVEPSAIAHFCMPAAMARVAQSVAKLVGLPEGSVRDNLQAQCGEAGVAHPLLMLAHALESAKPGERILVIGFGQGADALLFEAGEGGAPAKRRGVTGSLARRREETNYNRYLAFNDLVAIERGLRSEVDKQTALSALYRKREMLLGLVGGRCRQCGTLQFPKSNICVNPNCNAIGTQENQPFADLSARVMSYTADQLTYSPDPPQFYGMVTFEEGGRMMADFTDVAGAKVEVGMPMRMVFRIKEFDTARGFSRYFWKAAPAAMET
ncbi:MAG TPA: OB-fold domain-containing protein [Stellaceae bacterium]|nr:OB-fold domain-containing protein [Stellaceae bacterium]